MNIVIATVHKRYDSLVREIDKISGVSVVRINDPAELNLEKLKSLSPRYIFFPHWSWKIPSDIVDGFECVMFHMTDLPYGRGGSPLQNLIVRGISETKITAFRCADELDAGPVYLKENFSLFGTADEIFLRALDVVKGMVIRILSNGISPVEQKGEVTVFQRRSADDGNIAELDSLDSVFDYIRMLDGEGYPPAFVETQNLVFEFSRASFKGDSVLADVRIVKKRHENDS
jgi:methionyl-tRNA formyltransferase